MERSGRSLVGRGPKASSRHAHAGVKERGRQWKRVGRADATRTCRLPSPFAMASVHHAAAPARRIGRALAAGAIALALVGGPHGGADASPSARLGQAKDRLSTLTGRIGAEEARARELEDRLAGLDAQIRAATSRVVGIDAELATTRRELAAAAVRTDHLQARLDEMARSLFMQGAGSLQASMLSQVLGSSSVIDVDDLLTYGEVVSRADVDLAAEVANLRAELTMKTDDLHRLR